MKKKIFLILLGLIVGFSLTGCTPKDTIEVFMETDFEITLNGSFKKKEYDGFTYFYESSDSIVMAVKESFESLKAINLGKNSTLKEYANVILSGNEIDAEIHEKSNYMYFTYEKSVNGTDYYYYATVYKGKDAFWLLNFACLLEEKYSFTNDFIKWADSVKL